MADRGTRIAVADEAGLTHAVVEARRLASAAGFGAAGAAKIGTVVSELGRNILKYADRGDVSIRGAARGGRHGLTIVVRDRGPGIPDLEQALADHFSTSGTLGLGLPGVRRMVDEFDIESEAGRGTKVTVTMWL
jgi:serine/threonine-protein kinase RsbT